MKDKDAAKDNKDEVIKDPMIELYFHSLDRLIGRGLNVHACAEIALQLISMSGPLGSIDFPLPDRVLCECDPDLEDE